MPKQTQSKGVVMMGNLADFLAQVPPGGPVYLSHGTRYAPRKAGKFVVPRHEITLIASTFDAAGHALLLTEKHEIETDGVGKPLGGRAASIEQGMATLYKIVKAYLARHGYKVFEGLVGVPEGIMQLTARFECAQWQKQGQAQGEDCYEVVPVDGETTGETPPAG